MSRGMKILVSLVVVIALAVGGLLVAVKMVVTKERVMGYIAPVVEQKFHRKVSLQEVSVGLSALHLKGFTLSERLPSSESFISVGDLQVSYELMPLILQKKIQIGAITVVDPKVKVVKYANGKFNFSDLLESLSQEEEGKEEPKNTEAAADPLTIEKVRVKDGVVVFEDQSVPTRPIYNLALSTVEMGPVNLGGSIPYRFEATVEKETKVEGEGKLNVLASSQFGSLTVENLVLSLLNPYLEKGQRFQHVAVEKVEVNESLSWSGSGSLKVDRATVKVANQELVATARVSNLFTGPVSKVHLLAKRIIPAELLVFWQQATGEEVEKGPGVAMLPVENVDAEIFLTPKEAKLTSFKCIVAEGDVVANGKVSLVSKNRPFSGHNGITNLNIDTLVRASMPSSSAEIKGRLLSSRVDVEGWGKTPKEVKYNLKGSFNANVSALTLTKTKLNKVLATVLGSQEWTILALKPTTVSGYFAKGNAYIRKTTIKDAKDRFSFVVKGWVTLDGESFLDADLVLNRRLAGKMLGKGLARVLPTRGDNVYLPIAIRGNLSDPSVTPKIQSALQKTLLNKATGTVKVPAKAPNEVFKGVKKFFGR